MRNATSSTSSLQSSSVPTSQDHSYTADELWRMVVDDGGSFWDTVYVIFHNRDTTRDEIRDLLRQGLAVTNGVYRKVCDLFHIPQRDYKRFLNFLVAHDLHLDFHLYRERGARVHVVQ